MSSNPEPATFLMTLLLRAIFKYSGKTNGARASETGLSGRANQFKQKLQNCEPINLSRFAVELRERHLKYWTPYSETHPKEHNSKRSTYHQWCALPAYQKGSGHSFASHPSQIHASQPASWCHLQCSSFQTFCSATPYVLRQRLESK